jgi:hypothetical protein
MKQKTAGFEPADSSVLRVDAASLWCPPCKLDVTKLVTIGRNDIRVVAGNTALNYMAGRKLPDYKLLNLRYGERFQAQDMDKIQPILSGLLGTPKLTCINNAVILPIL